jgi:hypothetical protein
MEAPFVRTYSVDRTQPRTLRVHAVSLLGPATSAGGLIWAILQPHRVTLLHPRGQGLWWLVFEPPLLVMVAGALFTVLVARQVIADLEGAGATSR